jgi:hypothetical protein
MKKNVRKRYEIGVGVWDGELGDKHVLKSNILVTCVKYNHV